MMLVKNMMGIIRNPSLQELINLIFTNDTGEDLEPMRMMKEI